MLTTDLKMGERFAAHQITPPTTSDALATYTFGFQPQEYSRFKYGSKSLARRFGRELAERLFNSAQFLGFAPHVIQPAGGSYLCRSV